MPPAATPQPLAGPPDPGSVVFWRDEIVLLARQRFGASAAVLIARSRNSSTGGLALRWNDALMEEVEQAGGLVVRSTGRLLVAVFDRSQSALDAAVQVQLRLAPAITGAPVELATSLFVTWAPTEADLQRSIDRLPAWKEGQIIIDGASRAVLAPTLGLPLSQITGEQFDVDWRGAARRGRAMEPPRVDARYSIGGMIGAGGMASVWRGRDLRLERTVAIKVLHRHLDLAPRARDRFRREAQIAASLVHDNVVQVFDYSDAAAQESFIAMEMVEGRSLRRYLTGKGPLPEVVATAIGHEIARGLAYAHSRGVIHRDCKPDNVLLSSIGAVKLGDFGIAGVQEMARLTATGGAVGSPAYMAPEQLEGKPPEPANDVFGLGATLYEMVVGRPPFDGATPATVIRQIATNQYTPAQQLVPIGDAFNHVIAKALSRDPAKRYPDAQGVLHDLRELLDARGVGDPRAALSRFLSIEDPAELAEVARRFAVESTSPSRARPRWLIPGIAAGALVLAAAVAGGMAFQGHRRPEGAPIAAAPSLAPPAPAVLAPSGPAPAPPSAPEPGEVALPESAAAPSPPPAPKSAAPVVAAPAERPAPAVPTHAPRSHRRSEAQESRSAAAEKPGELDVWVSPWAEGIRIDGEMKGNGRPPPLRVKLSAGKHQVEVTHPNLKSFAGTVEVASGQTLRVKVDLQAGTLTPQP